MRILQTVFQMMDYGGIVNYTETLTRGLVKLGHEVDVVLLRNSASLMTHKKANTTIEGAYRSTLRNASYAHAAYGWYGMPVYSYGSKAARREWRAFAAQYDLIIHQIPVPAMDAKGHWKRVYDGLPPQLLVSHDAHFPDRYPHMLDIADKVLGIAAVNPASYMSLEGFPAPRCLIGSPHRLRDWGAQTPWEDRPRRLASAHVWKEWKRMDKLLLALPFLRKAPRIENWIAGDGIAARYMRAMDTYTGRWPKKHLIGVWKTGMRAGMHYAGMVSPREIAAEYAEARVMVDLSYSKNFARWGNHVNRSLFEAYNAGCIPLVVHENMVEPKGVPHLFRDGDTHVEVAADATPRDIADAIRETCTMPPKHARTIIANGRALLKKHWSAEASAKYFLQLAAHHPKAGIYRRLVTGTPNDALLDARAHYMGD